MSSYYVSIKMVTSRWLSLKLGINTLTWETVRYSGYIKIARLSNTKSNQKKQPRNRLGTALRAAAAVGASLQQCCDTAAKEGQSLDLAFKTERAVGSGHGEHPEAARPINGTDRKSVV